MEKKLGFIGCGNMAKAMIGGILAAGMLAPEDIIASDAYRAGLEQAAQQMKIDAASGNKEVAQNAQIVVLAVKPQFYPAVIGEIAPVLSAQTIVISIAPGQTLAKLGERFARDIKIIRAMPNTPAMVCEGMTAVCRNERVTDEELAYVCKLFDGFGKTEAVAETLMDAVVAISGSSPAYVYMFIEAMADAAVKEGMPRDKAYTFAAQAVYGSAKMVLKTGLHPGVLKDNVCSPGGTTIEAVGVLEQTGFRSSVMQAMAACAKKAREM